MGLPEKNHFSLVETAARWNAQLADLYYYAKHGMLEVQTWIDIEVGKLFDIKTTTDGDAVPVQKGFDNYNGYVVLDPQEIRKIIRADVKVSVENFRLLAKADLIKPLNGAGFMVGTDNLVVSRQERHRFETEHQLGCCCERVLSAAQMKDFNVFEKSYPSFAGRPSVMRPIINHFQERAKSKTFERSLQRESNYLYTWAEKNIPNEQIPRPKTIQNAIREDYRRFSSAA